LQSYVPSQVFEFTTPIKCPTKNLIQQFVTIKEQVLPTPPPIKPKSPPTLIVSTLFSDGLLMIQPLPPSTTIASHDTKPPPLIHMLW
jgi:hypothetical protein